MKIACVYLPGYFCNFKQPLHLKINETFLLILSLNPLGWSLSLFTRAVLFVSLPGFCEEYHGRDKGKKALLHLCVPELSMRVSFAAPQHNPELLPQDCTWLLSRDPAFVSSGWYHWVLFQNHCCHLQLLCCTQSFHYLLQETKSKMDLISLL